MTAPMPGMGTIELTILPAEELVDIGVYGDVAATLHRVCLCRDGVAPSPGCSGEIKQHGGRTSTGRHGESAAITPNTRDEHGRSPIRRGMPAVTAIQQIPSRRMEASGFGSAWTGNAAVGDDHDGMKGLTKPSDCSTAGTGCWDPPPKRRHTSS